MKRVEEEHGSQLEGMLEALQQTLRREVREQVELLRYDLADRIDGILGVLENLQRLVQGTNSSVAAASLSPNSKLARKATDRQKYREMIECVRQVVANTLPANAIVAVVSKGDSELVQFEGRQGWHCPQMENGAYAGFYPKDSAAAIAEVERIRAKGAHYLLFPTTALWWLEHYTDFAAYLASHYPVIARDEQTCLIFALQESSARKPVVESGNAQAYRQLVRQVRGLVDSVLPLDAKVLVVSKGDPALLELGKRVATHFPQDATGGYTGYHPASSVNAIGHLEDLRRTGAEFLVIPKTTSWWLDYYQEFRQHLETHYLAVVRQQHVCTIFDLEGR